MGKTTSKELTSGASSNAQIMLEAAKREVFCKHPSHGNSSIGEQHFPKNLSCSI